MLCTKIVFLFFFWHSKQYLYTTCSELVFITEFNEQSLVIFWVKWFKNESFWKRFTCRKSRNHLVCEITCSDKSCHHLLFSDRKSGIILMITCLLTSIQFQLEFWLENSWLHLMCIIIYCFFLLGENGLRRRRRDYA